MECTYVYFFSFQLDIDFSVLVLKCTLLIDIFRCDYLYAFVAISVNDLLLGMSDEVIAEYF